MMSESVTVTVQNGNEAGRGPAIAPLNVSYFSTTPGLCKVAQLVSSLFAFLDLPPSKFPNHRVQIFHSKHALLCLAST
uniref:Uncharacterized protein n=1 Tax=Trichogramma kaykai TaxID=54128 RepID=A0ABD2W4S1_9HYME